MKTLNGAGVAYLWKRIKALVEPLATSISNHTGNTSNPHNVTKAQIGLGEFDYEEGTFIPKFWSGSGDEQTFGWVEGHYKKIGNLCYIFILAQASSDVSVAFVDNLPFAPNINIYRTFHEKGLVFANGGGCLVNVPHEHGQINLGELTTGNLLVEGIYSI